MALVVGGAVVLQGKQQQQEELAEITGERISSLQEDVSILRVALRLFIDNYGGLRR